jgi:hypothetical protein
MSKPSVNSRRTVAAALAVYAVDVTEESNHVTDIIIQVRAAMSRMPHTRSIKEEKLVLTDLVANTFITLLECFAFLVHLGDEDWASLTYAIFASSVLGTKSANTLPRLIDNINEWTKAATDGKSIVIGKSRAFLYQSVAGCGCGLYYI